MCNYCSERYGVIYGQAMQCLARANDYCSLSRGASTQMKDLRHLRQAARDLNLEWSSTLEKAFEFLSQPKRRCLKANSSHDAYALQADIATCMAEEFMCKAILSSYGSDGLRVWGVLKDKNLMEERDVAKAVLTPERETRVILLNMLRDDMVMMQEVPKTTDAAVLRTYYLYGVEETRAFRSLYLRACKMLQNTLCRLYQVRQDVVRLEAKAEATSLKEDELILDQARREYRVLSAQISLLVDDLILMESPLHSKLVQPKPPRPKRGAKKKAKKDDDDGNE